MRHADLLEEYPALGSLLTSQRELFDECVRVVALFEDLSRTLARFVRPLDEATDAEAATLRREVLALSCQARVFSLSLPRSLGGGGCSMLSLALGLERLAQRCAGLASLLGTHGLALALLGACGNVAWLIRVAQRIIAGEAQGAAYLLSTAATEPSAGSDLEDYDELARATLESHAEPVASGYRLTGAKIYVSNGDLASAHVVLMPLCRERPRETLTAFLVPRETVGLKVVRTESKLGQRASPAAHLQFDDCFIPETGRISSEPVSGRALDLVLGASRSFIGAFGAGIARGVYETCLRHDHRQNPCRGTLLGRMWSNARHAQLCYLEANLVNSRLGLVAFSNHQLLRLLDRHAFAPFLGLSGTQRLLGLLPLNTQARRVIAEHPYESVATASSYGSAAKVRTSELALENCALALELLGATATREDTGLPKYWRDARLLAIYEGTNEICLIDVAKKQGLRSQGPHDDASR